MFYLIIVLLFGVAGALVARSKGNSMVIWFLISAIVPFLGLIAAIMYRAEADEPRRQCPGCGKVVMAHDALCTRCGTELEYPDELLQPPAAAV